ncbi:TonB-dependent receptor [Shewanella sp.]|uniref:TonB-dependent receptor domain-containing protein n=1 Tax=Shewanella sp. TaxID=50422 RepID=UPI001A4B7C44|nr:TonB-dependent receptor [Shewanella sp.]MBL4815988.1 TonB-dependent receptor [Shewanella sp.]MCJ8304061.1 TonB-dependent receptor [Shewanella sp.]
MYKNSLIAKSVRFALIGGAAAATFTAPVVFAADEVVEEAQVERIEVTGSRLRSTDMQGFSPVQVIDSSDIDMSSVANIQELLLKNPAFGTPAISRTNSNFSTSSAGAAVVDLRNLGTERTLVLVNGRRFVSGIPGDSAVDLNSIPTQFIERVEIMTGGASAIYGSDAVAGVVNIIYKKDFEGIEFDVQRGQSAEGDSDETQIQFTMGTSSSDGKGNVMIHGAYTEQGAVYSRDRERSAVDQASEGAYFTGLSEDFFTARRPFYSSYSPQGRFFAGDTQYTFNKAGELVEGWSTNGSDTTEANGFNRMDYRTIAIPTERYLLAASGKYEFVDGWNAFFEGTYASTQTSTALEPFPMASDDVYSASGGQMPLEYEQFIESATNPGEYERTLVRNAFVPDDIFNSATDTNGDGIKDIFFTRRLADVAARGNTADRDTFRVVAGIDGEITEGWYLDAYYGYGQTKESQVGSGQFNSLNFRSALEAIEDEDGNIVCRDADAVAEGCAPVSVFGKGSISAEGAAYIDAPNMLTTFTSQTIAGLNVSGELFELPAGYVGLAGGVEYREEYSRSEFDALQASGLNGGNAIPRTEGEFDVIEYFAEINVPILSDVFLAQQLNLRGALRLSDYSTVGNTESWNIALDWAPIDGVRFRGIRAQSTRAPNINELFSPPSQTYPTGLTDPCLGVTAATSGSQAEACRADAGVMSNINANGEFTLSQADLQGISGFNRGNPDLDAEEGKSWTFGVTISPEGLAVIEDFDFNIDYYDIEIKDAIVSTPRQFILEDCYGGTGETCSFVTRRAKDTGPNSAGSLEYIDSAVTNSGGFANEGIDLVVTYAKDFEDYGLAGQVNARLAYTYVIDAYTIPLPGSEKDQNKGEIGAAENKFYLSLGYNYEDLTVSWSTTFIGESYLDDQFLTAYGYEPESVGIGSVTYHDLNVAYQPWDMAEFYIGVNNLFDQEPPKLITGLPGSNTGTETDAGTYDPIGRRYYAGVRLTF